MCDDLFDDDVSEIKTGELLWLKNSKNLHLVCGCFFICTSMSFHKKLT